MCFHVGNFLILCTGYSSLKRNAQHTYILLQVLDNGRRLHLGDAADATKQAFSGFAKKISSVIRLPFQGLQNIFNPGPNSSPVDLQRQPTRAERQPLMVDTQSEGTTLQAEPLPAGATVRVSVTAVPDGDQRASPMEARTDGAYPAPCASELRPYICV